jgi:hypothetical protein
MWVRLPRPAHERDSEPLSREHIGRMEQKPIGATNA